MYLFKKKVDEKSSLEKSGVMRSKKIPISTHWPHQSIEFVLKQHHTLCVFGHWFEPGQPANGLKQAPYCGQHNMASREQQVSRPHSYTINKRKKTHKEHVSSDWFLCFLLLQPDWGMCVISLTVTRRTNYDAIYVVSFETFLKQLQERCWSTAWYDCASPLQCISNVLLFYLAFYFFCWALISASRKSLHVNITVVSGSPGRIDSEITESALRPRLKGGRRLFENWDNLVTSRCEMYRIWDD